MKAKQLLLLHSLVYGVLYPILLLFFYSDIYSVYTITQDEFPHRLILPLVVFGLSGIFYSRLPDTDANKRVYVIEWLIYHIIMIFYNLHSSTLQTRFNIVALAMDTFFAVSLLIQAVQRVTLTKDKLFSPWNMLFFFNGLIHTLLDPLSLFFWPSTIFIRPDVDGAIRLGIPIFAVGLGSTFTAVIDSPGKRKTAWAWFIYHSTTIFQLWPTSYFHSDNLKVGVSGFYTHLILAVLFGIYLLRN